MQFYVGLDDIYNAKHFERCFISVNRLKARKGDFAVNDWIMDSGAFTQIATHGDFQMSPESYGEQINRWARCGNMLAAITQDYMCEPFIVERTGLSVTEHQARTIYRYRRIQALTQRYVMPVLQGYASGDYLRHVDMYGPLLRPDMWVGVGSICKRNSQMSEIERVLLAIKRKRPDLRLHGFGLKITALRSSLVWDCLHSADSMAWSYNARKQGRSAHDWREAEAFSNRIASQPRIERQEWLLCD